jgi:hypothetical protein
MLSIRTAHCGSLFPQGRAAQVRSEAWQVERADLGLARRHAGGGPVLDAELGGGVTHLSQSAHLNSTYPDITATTSEDHAAGGGARREARWRHGWSSTRHSGRRAVASSGRLRGPCGGRRRQAWWRRVWNSAQRSRWCVAASSVGVQAELGAALRGPCGGRRQARWRRGWSSARRSKRLARWRHRRSSGRRARWRHG